MKIVRRLLESTIEGRIKHRALHELGVPSLKLYSKHESGWPDQIFFIPGGRPLLIEMKRPGEDLREKQEYAHKILKTLGYDVITCDNVDGALLSIAGAVDAARRTKKGGQVSS